MSWSKRGNQANLP